MNFFALFGLMLRAAFVSAPLSSPRTSPFASSLPSSTERPTGRGFTGPIATSEFGSAASGMAGKTLLSLFSTTPSSAGTATPSASNGAGSPEATRGSLGSMAMRQFIEKSSRRSPVKSSPNRWSVDCITAIGELRSVSPSRSAGFRHSADRPPCASRENCCQNRGRLARTPKTPHSSSRSRLSRRVGFVRSKEAPFIVGGEGCAPPVFF